MTGPPVLNAVLVDWVTLPYVLSGLRGLADRVEALDGRLRVWSAVGGGTRVRAEIPCA